MVDTDTAFREQIRLSLNDSELFDQLESKYATWTIENPWTDVNSVFYWLTVMTTIGYGNIIPITTEGRAWTVIFGVFSIFISALSISVMANSHREIFNVSNTYKRYPKTCHSLLLIFSTLIFAAIFYYLERDSGVGPMGEKGWSYTESLYFVFTTFTTVGFGDFIPEVGLTVILIVYGIIMIAMMVGEAHACVTRIETDMVEVIKLAEKGYDYARQNTLKFEANADEIPRVLNLDYNVENLAKTIPF